MSPRFVLGRENVPCVAEVVSRSLKADCTDFTNAAKVDFDNFSNLEEITSQRYPPQEGNK